MNDEALERLRRASGVQDDRKPMVGAAHPSTFEQRQKVHAEFMRMLHEGGSDPQGVEGFREAMRRLGR